MKGKSPTLIEESERIAEVEEQVRYYTQITPDLPRISIIHKRVEYPQFKSEVDRDNWELNEIKRCIHGHKGMCGKMYFYFNYCFIQNLQGGKVCPEFRVADNAYFTEESKCSGEDLGWGIVCVKRRRAGFSWKAAASSVHDALFTKYFRVGMNSKTERDSIKLLKKVRFIYDNLPPFLRAKCKPTKSGIDFSYDAKDGNGNKVRRGNESEIFVVPPTDTAFEGEMMGKWVCDEAGKIANLPQIWSYTVDCLMQETVRRGVPVLFGTSGEVGKEGRGLKSMWDNSEAHKLKRFFFGGWMGLYCDEFGNDRKEEAIRWILYERKRLERLGQKQYTDFVQKYPLTPEEAFAEASSGGLGDLPRVSKHANDLKTNPPFEKTGRFEFNDDGTVNFIPQRFGKVIIYEPPKPGDKNMYVAACDPVDHDSDNPQSKDLSNLSMHIMRRPDGISPARVVLEYVDRTEKAVDMYNQVLMALIYYGDCKILIEKNRFRMISEFEASGYKHLLMTTPQGVTRMIGARSNTIGITMNDSTKKFMESLIESYIDEHCEEIPSIGLLGEFSDYRSKNTDRVMSFGICLMAIRENKARVKNSSSNPNSSRELIGFRYVKVNGKIKKIDKKSPFWGV